MKQIKRKLDDIWQSVTSRREQRAHGRLARLGAAAEARNSYEMSDDAFARPSLAESSLLPGCKRVLCRGKPGVATLIHFPALTSAHVQRQPVSKRLAAGLRPSPTCQGSTYPSASSFSSCPEGSAWKIRPPCRSPRGGR